MKHTFFSKKYRSLQAGLTLVELIVVLAIVAVVSGVIIFNYSSFKGTATLRGLSQDIALTIRKAQTYATSVQSITTGGSTTSFPAFGISFTLDGDTATNVGDTSRKQFVLFADIAGSGSPDGLYTNGGTCGSPASGNECVESFAINTPDKIIQLCTDSGCFTSGRVDVVFNRPAPDAYICTPSGSSCPSTLSSFASIVVQSASGQQKTIKVWNTGQISIE